MEYQDYTILDRLEKIFTTRKFIAYSVSVALIVIIGSALFITDIPKAEYYNFRSIQSDETVYRTAVDSRAIVYRDGQPFIFRIERVYTYWYNISRVVLTKVDIVFEKNGYSVIDYPNISEYDMYAYDRHGNLKDKMQVKVFDF